jgi:aspartate carbamoyltransferase catalytic subunit
MKVVPEVDVVYQTRIQRERFGDRTADYEKARGKYIIDKKVMSALSDDAIVMHPLPRVDEIDPVVDRDPRAAYFRQAHNGVFIRMALLRMVLEG